MKSLYGRLGVGLAECGYNNRSGIVKELDHGISIEFGPWNELVGLGSPKGCVRQVEGGWARLFVTRYSCCFLRKFATRSSISAVASQSLFAAFIVQYY